LFLLRSALPVDRGTTLVSFGIAFPLIGGVVGLDHAGAAQTRGKMHAVTDAAARYAAREFQMVQANVEQPPPSRATLRARSTQRR
jgi:Flp pilus assembly protein TadG